MTQDTRRAERLERLHAVNILRAVGDLRDTRQNSEALIAHWRRLTDDEIFSHVRLLFPTGGETTHGALGNLLYALLTHEGEWQQIVQDPHRIEAAVEESLRWETPIAVLPRMSRSEPVEFEGTRLAADSWVLFAIAGANRDPEVGPPPRQAEHGRSPRGARRAHAGPRAAGLRGRAAAKDGSALP